jgi:hypothetical protein
VCPVVDTIGVRFTAISHQLNSPLRLLLLPLVVGAVMAASHRSVELPRNQGELFSGSGNCAACHSPDSMDPAALRGQDGSDVSPPSFWRSTMMANAAKDPLWQAKVSAEVAANPGLKAAIEDKCITCHAPMGRLEDRANGGTSYSLEQMRLDPLALDGVSCTVCHQIKPDNLGQDESFSGGFEVSHDQTIYGPYTDPFGWPMLAMSGYEPVYGEHINSSALCATCHTLFTDSVDETGAVTGRLPEQTPYLEWLNSSFPAEDIQCQTCHMPVEPAPVPIANTPRGLDAREPFYRHEFVGGNAYMLTMLRDNAEALGVTAESVHFDSTIARTRRVLASAATVVATPRWVGDTLEVDVHVQNWSGHKLPTGYPSRRMWLEVKLTDASGNTVFHSGGWDPDTGKLDAEPAEYSPHLEVITSGADAQVYQSMLGTPDGEPTHALLRASGYLKDNRIPPQGWTSSGPRAGDTPVTGAAATDPDFNRDAGIEGTGADNVTYRIRASDQAHLLEVRLLYQSVSPRYAEDLLSYQTDEVDRFREMYMAASNAPEVMAEVALEIGASVGNEAEVHPSGGNTLTAYPNPAVTGVSLVQSAAHADAGVSLRLGVYDILGRRIRTLAGRYWDLRGESGQRVAPGLYFVVDESSGAPGASAAVSVSR